MDKKAIAEIRKLMTMNNCRIDKIRGCYVDENREIVTELHETFLALEESTVEKYCEIFRQTLGGKPGKNLFNLEFPLEEEAGRTSSTGWSSPAWRTAPWSGPSGTA